MNRLRSLWQQQNHRLIVCGLLILAFVLYAGSFSHPWLHDDRVVILENPDVRSIEQFVINQYPGRPLREITYLLDYRLFGNEPAGWHLQNIFWHGLNGGLLFMLLRHLGISIFAAIGAALIFLVHPLQVEVVANVANRKDSLALCFSLICLLAWTVGRTDVRNRLGWLTTAGGALVLALLAKEHVIVIPLAILAWELLLAPSDCRLRWLNWRWPCGIAVAGVLGGGLWLWMFGGLAWFESRIPWKLGSLNIASNLYGDYFRAVLAGWGEQFRRVVVPLNLSPEYVYPVPAGWLDAQTLVPPIVVAGLVSLVVYWRQRWPVASFASAWCLLLWLPLSNLLPVGYFVADRYLYAPMAGLATLGALLLERSLPTAGARRIVLVGSVCLLSGLTWQQNRAWSSATALWSQAVRVSPTSAVATLNLGDALLRDGDQEAAIRLFLHAISINSAAPYPYYNLGVIYERQGEKKLAIRYFQQFLQRAETSLNPDHRKTAARLMDYLQRKYGSSWR